MVKRLNLINDFLIGMHHHHHHHMHHIVHGMKYINNTKNYCVADYARKR